MSRPKLLDFYCGGGGCARGYDLAGFDVVGCDIEPQPRYPYPFVKADALALLDCLLSGGGFCASDGRHYTLADIAGLHASPLCQDSTVLKNLHKHKVYPKLIGPTRDLLRQTGLPYVIENVPPRKDAEERLIDPVLLCGTMFGLRTSCGAELRRHRLFECSWGLILTPTCQHYAERPLGVYGTGLPMEGKRTVTVTGHSPMDGKRVICVMGGHARDRAADLQKRETICIVGKTAENRAVPRPKQTISVTGATPQQNVVRNTIRQTYPVSAAREAMGIDWLTMKELSQAIPPAYTEFLGKQLLCYLEAR